MFEAEIKKISEATQNRIRFLNRSLLGYLILSALAGIYLAFGISLSFFLGGQLTSSGSPFARSVMGVSFGLALVLVVFAGAELFTGNNMFGMISGLSRQVSWRNLFRLWFWCYVGNLLGSLFLAWLLVQSGLFSAAPQAELIGKATLAKMTAPFWQIFVRGILANWLVCLALWTANRASSETAKIILIAWCLFAFVAPGFEHSIANMSILGMGLFLPHGAAISWAGFWRNLSSCTLGNFVGGGLFVGGTYWLVSPAARQESPAPALAPSKETMEALVSQ